MQRLRSNLVSSSFLSKVIRFANISSFCVTIRQRDKIITKKQILLL